MPLDDSQQPRGSSINDIDLKIINVSSTKTTISTTAEGAIT